MSARAPAHPLVAQEKKGYKSRVGDYMGVIVPAVAVGVVSGFVFDVGSGNESHPESRARKARPAGAESGTGVLEVLVDIIDLGEGHDDEATGAEVGDHTAQRIGADTAPALSAGGAPSRIAVVREYPDGIVLLVDINAGSFPAVLDLSSLAIGSCCA